MIITSRPYKYICNLFGACIYPLWVICGAIFLLGTKEILAKTEGEETWRKK